MREDYQLAYCPIAHITSLAFADDAFENTRLTPELLHKLRVPDQIRRLREQRLILRDEIRTLYGTLKKAKHADRDRYREHETVVKELARVRAIHRRERKAEFRQDYFETMPVEEIDKQI